MPSDKIWACDINCFWYIRHFFCITNLFFQVKFTLCVSSISMWYSQTLWIVIFEKCIAIIFIMGISLNAANTNRKFTKEKQYVIRENVLDVTKANFITDSCPVKVYWIINIKKYCISIAYTLYSILNYYCMYIAWTVKAILLEFCMYIAPILHQHCLYNSSYQSQYCCNMGR